MQGFDWTLWCLSSVQGMLKKEISRLGGISAEDHMSHSQYSFVRSYVSVSMFWRVLLGLQDAGHALRGSGLARKI